MRKYPGLLIVMLMLAVIVCVAILGLTGILGGKSDGKVMYAKIRYFDGTAEMIPIKKMTEHHASFELDTVAGDKIVVGANNVIIIQEDAECEQQ